MKKICVFCGSSKPENHTKLENEVISLGNLILKKKLQLVYGGAKIGLMGLVANTILEGGGYVTGIIPKLLSKKEIIPLLNNQYLIRRNDVKNIAGLKISQDG